MQLRILARVAVPDRHRASWLGVLAALLLAACGAPGVAQAPADCGADIPGLARTTVVVGVPGREVTLHVAVGGPLAAPPVVLLHGFPETGLAWRDVATDLAADHRVVVPDLRGVGCSSFAPAGADDYGAHALAGDLAALVTALHLAPATVAAHDMGAIAAYAWARERPDQVARLVVSGGGVPGPALFALGPPHLRTFAGPPGSVAPADLRGFLTRFVGGGEPELVDEAVRTYGRPGRLDAALGQYRALAADAADTRPLAMGVLALEPSAVGVTTATLAPLAPRLRTVVLPGAGHYVLQERPREVAAAIRAPDAAGGTG